MDDLNQWQKNGISALLTLCQISSVFCLRPSRATGPIIRPSPTAIWNRYWKPNIAYMVVPGDGYLQHSCNNEYIGSLVFDDCYGILQYI